MRITAGTPRCWIASMNALGGNQARLPAASDYAWTFTTAGVAALAGNTTEIQRIPPLFAAAGAPVRVILQKTK